MHFRPGMGENKGIHQCLHWWMQQSPGLLRFDLFESCSIVDSKKDTTQKGGVFFGGDNRTRTCDLMRVKHAL